jgi:hypothetical protein
MTQARGSGSDPIDGLRLAMLQQNADQLRKQLKFSTFGAKEILMLIMLTIDILFLLSGKSGSPGDMVTVLGWLLITQAFVLYWSLRRAAARHLKLVEQRIAAATSVPDGAVITEAAGAARELLLRK